MTVVGRGSHSVKRRSSSSHDLRSWGSTSAPSGETTHWPVSSTSRKCSTLAPRSMVFHLFWESFSSTTYEYQQQGVRLSLLRINSPGRSSVRPNSSTYPCAAEATLEVGRSWI